MKFCSKCSAPLKDENSKFCIKCGSPVHAEDSGNDLEKNAPIKTTQRVCSKCGYRLRTEAKYCLKCGKSCEMSKKKTVVQSHVTSLDLDEFTEPAKGKKLLWIFLTIPVIILISVVIYNLGIVGKIKTLGISSLSSSGEHAKLETIEFSTLTDNSGNVYKTVVIGNQVWMAENLRVQIAESWCNNPAKCETYGRLYTWDAAMRACPAGWTLPNNSDWEELKRFVESKVGLGKSGKALKAKTENQSADALPVTDEFGFSAILAGDKTGDKYTFVDETGYYWSADDEDATHAYDWIFSGKSDDMTFGNIAFSYKKNGFSVRCIQKEQVQDIESKTITDVRDGKTYKTVKIGKQAWMAENLAFKTPESRCKENKQSLCKKYGELYTWIDAMQISADYVDKTYRGQGVMRGICPEGWHLPNYSEWISMLNHVGREIPKEKTWIALLNKNEVLEHRSFPNVGSEEELMVHNQIIESLGPGDVDYKEENDMGYNSFSRHHGTDVFGFNALVLGKESCECEDDVEDDYTAFWTSSDAEGKIYVINDDVYLHGNVKDGLLLPIRCVED